MPVSMPEKRAPRLLRFNGSLRSIRTQEAQVEAFAHRASDLCASSPLANRIAAGNGSVARRAGITDVEG